MPTARESVYCNEISEFEDKMSELQTLDPSSEATCITEHPGFSGVCLNMWVLQTTACHLGLGSTPPLFSVLVPFRWSSG